MADNQRMHEVLPATDIDPDDLRAILARIDDHLPFWNILYTEPKAEQVQPVREETPPVSLDDARAVSDWLRMSSAPLFPSEGARGVRAIIYRLLNAVIKVLGRPQAQFNRRLRDLLGEHLLTFEAFNRQVLARQRYAEELQARVQKLERENQRYRNEISALQVELAEFRDEFEHAMAERGENEHRADRQEGEPR